VAEAVVCLVTAGASGERRACSVQSTQADGRRRVELRQLKSAVAVRRLHEDDVDSDTLEPDDAVHPPALD